MLRRTRLVPLFTAVLIACGDDDPTRPTPDPDRLANALEVVSGADQIARVGQQLAQPIVVRVVDLAGEPVAGQAVGFHVARGNGAFVAGSDTSDENGLASDVWVLGTVADHIQLAEVRLVTGAGLLDSDSVAADALAGPLHRVEIAGDTVAELERGDTLEVEVAGFDEWGNDVAADSFDVAWDVSDDQVASVSDGIVIGLAEGDAVVSVNAADTTLRVHVHVEGTRSTFFRMWGNLAAGGDRLVSTTGDSLHQWTGSAWQGAPLGAMAFADIQPAPASGELWAAAAGVYRSDDGLSWTASLAANDSVGRSRLAFSPEGVPVVAQEVLDSPGVSLAATHRILRLEGASWVPLDMPRVVAGDTVVADVFDIAVAPNGDVYVGGYADDDPAVSGGRPYVARWDGASWTFLALPWATGWISHMEAGADGIVVVRQEVNALYDWTIARVSGNVVEVVDVPREGPYRFTGLAVSLAGEIAFTYYDANDAKAGVTWQSAGAWDTWEDPRVQTSPMEPVWHQGALWFPMSVGFTDEQYFVVRIEPQETTPTPPRAPSLSPES